jgi:hypothetical protein
VIRPVDLPKVRHELCRWYEHGAEEFFRDDEGASRQGLSAEARAESGLSAASRAELFFVSAEMLELATVAAKSVPNYGLQPEDLPSPSGLMYSPAPFFEHTPKDAAESALSYTGLLWRSLPPFDAAPNGGIVVGWLVDRSMWIDRDHMTDDLAAKARASFPPLFEDTRFVFWPFEYETIAEDDPAYMWSEAESPMFIAKTAWLLMQQTVATVSSIEYKRDDRRRLQREKITLDPVRIITLRRPRSDGEHGESDREYRHQWIVRGHWRQQWYPRRNVHRPVWIAPHVKGPEGAPMLGGEKVYTWTK